MCSPSQMFLSNWVFNFRASLSLEYQSLNRPDSISLLEKIVKRCGISDNINSTQELFKNINKSLREEVIYGDDFSSQTLSDLIKNHQLDGNSLVYIVWDYESSIDQIRFTDILKYWDYIWYDSSDEAIILYFPSIEKVVLITDHGVLKFN